MTREQLNRIFHRALWGFAASPLMLLPGCGRSAPFDETIVVSTDGGGDAGTDAGHRDGGTDGGIDGGRILIPKMSCFEKIDAGEFTFAQCKTMCAGVLQGNELQNCAPSGDVLLCSVFCGVGRLAPGVSATAHGAGLGRVLADMAAHEAAAVFAFEQLAGELTAHGLHASFARGALDAAWEEQQHVRSIGGLATQLGGSFSVARGEPGPTRSIEELAFDNAVEGCVRETFGSLLGRYQGRHALHPGVRRAMSAVSADEVGHGAWSWELASTLEARLPAVKRRQTREAREEALETISRGVLDAVPRAQHALLGLPDEERIAAMAKSMRDQLL